MAPPIAPERQYIHDRCDGKSYGKDAPKPALPCCWVPPCVKYCPTCLETNCICSVWGRCGVFKEKQTKGRTSVRTTFMSVGMCTNLIGMALTIVACFAISNDYNILTSTSWSEGTITSVNISDSFQTIHIDTGLRGVAIDQGNSLGSLEEADAVTSFDRFCDELEDGLGRYMDPDECDSCEESSKTYRSSIITTVVLYLPSIFTNWTRQFVNYDVNCQKFFGTIVAAISLFLAVYSMLGYKNDCWDGFYNGDVYYFASNYTVVPSDYEGGSDDEPIVVANFSWEPGTGFICLTVATILKFFDLVGHCLIQTPSITRNKDEKLEYHKVFGQDGEGGEGAEQQEEGKAKFTEEPTNASD